MLLMRCCCEMGGASHLEEIEDEASDSIQMLDAAPRVKRVLRVCAGVEPPPPSGWCFRPVNFSWSKLGYCLATSSSIVIFTSSPTTAAGKVAPTPKSLR